MHLLADGERGEMETLDPSRFPRIHGENLWIRRNHNGITTELRRSVCPDKTPTKNLVEMYLDSVAFSMFPAC